MCFLQVTQDSYGELQRKNRCATSCSSWAVLQNKFDCSELILIVECLGTGG